MAIQVIITWETEEDIERIYPSDGSRGIRKTVQDALDCYAPGNRKALTNNPPRTERLFIKEIS